MSEPRSESMAGVATRLILDPSGDLIAHSYQDVEDIIERNKALQSEPQRSDWGRHVATIPNNIMLAWLNEEWARGNISLPEWLERLLRPVVITLDLHLVHHSIEFSRED